LPHPVEIWGKAKRASARYRKSDWGTIREEGWNSALSNFTSTKWNRISLHEV